MTERRHRRVVEDGGLGGVEEGGQDVAVGVGRPAPQVLGAGVEVADEHGGRVGEAAAQEVVLQRAPASVPVRRGGVERRDEKSPPVREGHQDREEALAVDGAASDDLVAERRADEKGATRALAVVRQEDGPELRPPS